MKIRRELEELPSELAAHSDVYVHTFRRASSVGGPPPEKLRDWPKEKLRVQRRLGNRHAALNKALEKYVFRPRATCAIFSGRWMFGMVPDEKKKFFRITIGHDYASLMVVDAAHATLQPPVPPRETISEADAVISLVRLAETGELWKVRQCVTCKVRWLVAAKRNYRFCSGHCRDAFYAKSPDYHSRKAANQRKYRENLKRKWANEARLNERINP